MITSQKFFILAATSALLIGDAYGQAPDILVTVNAVPIRRAEVADRAYRQYGTAVINQMADEILILHAVAGLKVKADGGEVEARLKRLQGQFSDEATFKAQLAQSGSNLAQLRSSVQDQVLREALVTKAKGLSISEGELKDFFAANKARLGQPEAVRLRHILVITEKEANDFLAAIRAGADFAKLAAQVSLDNDTKGRGGEMGLIARGMFQPDIEKVVFSLKAGEVGGPVRTPLGFHLLKAEEVRAAKPAVFSEVKSDLRQALWNDKITKAWPDYLKELRDKAKYEPVLETRLNVP